jgi:CDGSH-type Zn-finger protein
MTDVTITVRKNGPYLVCGSVEVRDADGNPYPAKGATVALCRCGASTKKPFCDGTHSKVGFQAAEQAVPDSAEG